MGEKIAKEIDENDKVKSDIEILKKKIIPAWSFLHFINITAF